MKMKKLACIALLLVGMTGLAQDKSANGDSATQKVQWTPEQKNQLRLKELTLKLDLTTAQQSEMKQFIAEQQVKKDQLMAERKSRKTDAKKLTSDEKFVMKNKMLDEKIATKERLKKILNPEQLEKYEKMKHHKKNKMQKFSRIRKMNAEQKRLKEK